MCPQTKSKTLAESRDLALLEVAQNPLVSSAELSWPALENLVQAMNKLQRNGSGEISEREERFLQQLRNKVLWRLGDGPIAPRSLEVEFAEVFRQIGEIEEVGSPNIKVILHIEELARKIYSENHPAQEYLENWISARPISKAQDSQRAGSPATALCCVDEHSRTLTDKWLRDENLFADSIRYKDLRKAEPYIYCVLFGSPSRYAGWRNKKPRSDFKTQWLLTSPPAGEVLILRWSPHVAVRTDLIGPWEGFSFCLDNETTVERHFIPETIEFFENQQRSQPPTFGSQLHEVSARRFELAGPEESLWAFFSDELGPRPRLYRSVDDDLLDSRTSSVTQGQVLVFTSSEVANEKLDAEAARLWAQHSDYGDYKSIKGTVDKYRGQIRDSIIELGLENFVRQLVRRGLAEAYSKGVAERMLHLDQLAPREFKSTTAVCNAASVPEAATFYGLVTKVRAARQQAGRALKDQLLSQFASETSEVALESLATNGYVEFEFPGWGKIFLAQVLETGTQHVRVPYERLGKLVTSQGATWLE